MSEPTDDLFAATGDDSGEKRKLQPALFIGVGGTGMEVLLRLRRRILHARWGERGAVRLDSVEDFPVAEFLHFDLDQGAVAEGGRSVKGDPLAPLVQLPPQDRVINTLDMMKYLRSDDDLYRYPHIAAWCPLTSERVKGLDVSKGAGQMRPLSRLYFYDVYPQLRDAIQQKLHRLRANRANKAQLDRLRLDVDNRRVRVVVVCSSAGGTGSGSFLDFGWLAKNLAATTFGGSSFSVELMLFTPRGYEMANADRTKANGYASLMELETCMSKFPQYVGTWDPAEGPPALDPTPYSDVYIVESSNMARHALENVTDVYEMVADALFEDFACAEFATRKRSIAVNQVQHKVMHYSPPLAFKDSSMKLELSYCKGYSAFGQSIMDTMLSQQQDHDEYRLGSAMLEAFFGIASGDASTLWATDKNRDDFLKDHLDLSLYTFTKFPEFSNKQEQASLCAPFVDNQLTLHLLHDDRGGVEEAIRQKINVLVEEIKADQASIKEWARLLREKIPVLEKDVIRNQDTKTVTVEEHITRRGADLREKKFAIIREKLYDYLDNREFGGLEFVLSLSELLKTAFIDPFTGLAKQLDDNAQRYRKVRDALKTNQIEETLSNIAGAVRGGFLSGPDTKKALNYLDNLKGDLAEWLCFHARSVAASTGAALLRELADNIGGATGVDERGEATYSGLLHDFHKGRREVLAVSREIVRATMTIEDSKKKGHSNYLLMEVEAVPLELPDAKILRTWANEAFKDFEGSRKIFAMLGTTEGKAKLLGRLRRRAAAVREELQPQSTSRQADPLLRSLLDMEPSAQREKFEEFLRAAMPWVDANFGNVPLSADQFKCVVGVMSPSDWAPLLNELQSCVPVEIGITAQQVQLLATGIPGRAVCFCELSGFPLTVLKGLGEWRTKYRQVGQTWPSHTHKDPTLFVHPLVPSTTELKQTADDMRLFMLAVMVRKLVRNPRKTIPPGLYQFDFGRGDWKNLGNERAFRLNGLPTEFRGHVELAVNDVLDGFDGVQMYALASLADYYGRQTYMPAVYTTDTGTDKDRPGFMHGIALALKDELVLKARSRGLSEGEQKRFDMRLSNWGEGWGDLAQSFDLWTEVVAESNEDAHTWEVKDSENNNVDRCKRRFSREAMNPEFLRSLLGTKPESVVGGVGGGAHIAPPMAGERMLPPLPLPVWHMAVGSQQAGPFTIDDLRTYAAAGSFTESTLVWKAPMPSWLPAGQVPELILLFAPPIPGGGAMPPPLPGGGTPPPHM